MFKGKMLFCGLGVWLVLSVSSAWACTFTAKVVGVSDGDTVKVVAERHCHDGRTPCKRGKVQYRIRLAQIDAPEKGQPWGQKARQALADRVFGKFVQVEQVDVDRYGRLVADLYVGGDWVNADMVRNGHAWVYRKYLLDESLPELEAAARKAGLGLWSLPESQRQAPWDWRKAQRDARQADKGDGDEAAAE